MIKISQPEIYLAPTINRPHVVFLGAGASKAAFPDGDKYGRPLPLMKELFELPTIQAVLGLHNFKPQSDDFEKVYSELRADPKASSLCRDLEIAIQNYFSQLELPDSLTIYDKLLLGLRQKDVIATFNWDPLLVQAYARNQSYARLPDIRYLHGNVAVAYCSKDGSVGGVGLRCPNCNQLLKPTKLLYPFDKNYTDEEFIAEEWKAIRQYIQKCFMITFFGYSAPESDKEATKLLKTAWELNSGYKYFTTECIDIRSDGDLRDHWSDFYFSSHFVPFKKFEESYIGKYPRRSCEYMFLPTVEGKPLPQIHIPQFKELAEFRLWLAAIMDCE